MCFCKRVTIRAGFFGAHPPHKHGWGWRFMDVPLVIDAYSYLFMDVPLVMDVHGYLFMDVPLVIDARGYLFMGLYVIPDLIWNLGRRLFITVILSGAPVGCAIEGSNKEIPCKPNPSV